MALQLTEFRNVFSVYGKLNMGNVTILEDHLRKSIHPDQHITLNLERVDEIDTEAALSLRELFIEAMRRNSVLSIIGRENTKIRSVFKATKTAYILSHDRV